MEQQWVGLTYLVYWDYKMKYTQTGQNSWTLEVQENGKTKELFVEFPPDALNQVGWDIGDTLIWEELDHGAWSVRKKTD